jgi:tRNA G46 methylase TrmB
LIRDLTRRLVRGGVLNLATDDPAYALQMCDVLAAESELENLFEPEPYRSEFGGRIPTAYELEWRALGRSFHYFARRRRPAAAARLDTDRGAT